MNNKNKLLCGTLFVYLFAMAASLVSTTAFAVGGYTWDAGTSICTDDLTGLPVDPVFCGIVPPPPPPPPVGGGGAAPAPAPAPVTPSTTTTTTTTAKSLVVQQTFNTAALTTSDHLGTPKTDAPGKAVCHENSTKKCNVKPAQVSLSSDAFFLNASFGVKKFSDDASILGNRQEARSWSVVAGLQRDYDQWGFTLAIPVNKTTNNGGYSAMDSTSAGIQFSPQYHFLLAQVHGIALDFGAQIGYNHVWYDNLSELKAPSGAFALANFDNMSTANYGVSADISMPVGETTGVSGHVGMANFINLDNQSLMGRNTTQMDWNIGISQIVTPDLSLNAGIGKNHIRMSHFDDTYNYGMMKVGAAYIINPRGSMSFNLQRSFSDGFMQTTSGMLNFTYQLD